MASTLRAIASNLRAITSNLRAMASTLRAIASNLRAMASTLGKYILQICQSHLECLGKGCVRCKATPGLGGPRPVFGFSGLCCGQLCVVNLEVIRILGCRRMSEIELMDLSNQLQGDIRTKTAATQKKNIPNLFHNLQPCFFQVTFFLESMTFYRPVRDFV